MATIFDPIIMGDMALKNRIVMAPMTRGRAAAGGVPSGIMAEYYALRAESGLIISEATAISPSGYGWNNAPGIWNEEQEQGWKRVTQAVHARDGKIVLQLWHMGRVSHPDFLNGELPVGPSAVAARGDAHTPSGTKPYVTPRALSIAEIEAIVGDYAKAAKRAMCAGFDGVEIHGANGYLIDQFIRDGSNQRTDAYGGTAEKRLRFLREVTQAVTAAVGAGKVGVRLSPLGAYNDMKDSDPVATFSLAAEMLSTFGLAYLHTMEALPGHPFATEGEPVSPYMRKAYRGVFITNGGYDKEIANNALASNAADAIAFGVPFLANPDLVQRLMSNAPLNTPDYTTFYTPGEKGYTDYPLLNQKAA